MEILNKISQYNLFNYLLPGVIFCVLIKEYWDLDLAGSNLLVAAFIYYFLGMCVSRIGSLIVEPTLKRVGYVEFSDYSDFLNAETQDPKIQELLTTANFYRSILGCLFSFLLLSVGLWLVATQHISADTLFMITMALIICLVLAGYRKQVSYIRRRVNFRKINDADS